MHRIPLPLFVVLAACSSSSGNGSSSGQTAEGSGQSSSGDETAKSGASSGTAGIASGTTAGAAGQPGTAGSGTSDASTTAPGALSDAMAPYYGDGAVSAVAPTPPAQWVNVTANLAGMPSECGNTEYLTSHPSYDMLITSVAQHGLWASTDGGASWKQLWPTAGANQITNRGTSILFDPDHAETFWESGIYNGPGVYETADNGATFAALGDSHHIDSVSVDFTDPQRMTLLAGGHEQKQTLYRSTDGGNTWTNVGLNLPGGTDFCTTALVLDSQTHLVGCSGYAGGIDGVFRTTDGGKTWSPTTTLSASGLPLWATDGTIYWSLLYNRGLIKSTDQGNSWTQTIPYGTLNTGHPIELPDGRIVAVGPMTLMISSDHGVSFQALGTAMPFAPNSITYSPYRNAFYIEQFDCNNQVLADAISRYGFDYRTP
jgi:BNR/Asp-box repeat protein